MQTKIKHEEAMNLIKTFVNRQQADTHTHAHTHTHNI